MFWLGLGLSDAAAGLTFEREPHRIRARVTTGLLRHVRDARSGCEDSAPPPKRVCAAPMANSALIPPSTFRTIRVVTLNLPRIGEEGRLPGLRHACVRALYPTGWSKTWRRTHACIVIAAAAAAFIDRVDPYCAIESTAELARCASSLSPGPS